MSFDRLAILCCCFAAVVTGASAESPAGSQEIYEVTVPEGLPPPDYVEHDEELEPEVTIIQREDATVSEYRINGQLYMLKVTPAVGKPYFFVDNDGDGVMESKISEFYNNTQIPRWVIFSW